MGQGVHHMARPWRSAAAAAAPASTRPGLPLTCQRCHHYSQPTYGLILPAYKLGGLCMRQSCICKGGW